MNKQMHGKSSRPLSVWVVSSYFVLVSTWTLLSTAVVLSESILRGDDGQQTWVAFSPAALLVSVAPVVMSLWSGLALFFLRRAAGWLFAIALMASVPYALLRWRQQAALELALGIAGNLLVLLLASLYACGLRKKHILS